MDTGKSGDASPWRIKVTVEAEPRNGSESPNKKERIGAVTKTMKIPIRSMESSSPTKNIRSPGVTKHIQDGVEESEAKVKRPNRKRKGTPIRRKVQPRAPPERTIGKEQDGLSEDAQIPLPPASPTARRKSGVRSAAGKRKSLQTLPKLHGQRLNEARESLDKALGDAIACGSDEVDFPQDYEDVIVKGDAPGDMTMMNEDFTMVSVETLQSIKGGGESSFLSNVLVGDKSALSVSYLPSSPPKPIAQHHSAVDEKGMTPAQVYEAMSWKLTTTANARESIQKNQPPIDPMITSKLRAARRDKDSSHVLQQVAEGDPMSWRFTDRPRNEASLRVEQDFKDQRANERQRDCKAIGQEIENAELSRVISVEEDSVDESQNQGKPGAEQEEEDIWQEEASRSLEDTESPEQRQNKYKRKRKTLRLEKPRAHPQHVPYSASAHEVSRLFTPTEPAKPARGKIPRTWRRTSGMDFHYSDSPAHEPMTTDDAKNKQDESAQEGGSRASSGVLTPPASAAEEDESAKEIGFVHHAEEGPAFDDGVSLTLPDAFGTQIQDPGVLCRTYEKNGGTPNHLSESSSSPGNSGDEGDDTGLFWQRNLPQAYNRQRRQHERSGTLHRQRAMDLSELLALHEKNRARDFRTESAGQENAEPSFGEKMYSPLRMNVEEGHIKMNSTDSCASKPLISPLGKILLKSSNMLANSVVKGKGTSMHSTGLHCPEEQHEKSAIFDESFESKASDQRQLLSEMASARKPTASSEMSRLAQVYSSFDCYEDNHQERDEAIEDMHDEESTGSVNNVEEDVSQYDHLSCSYEEHLNLDSPQKIRVKFNDSTGNSSLLAPKREYSSLFDENSNLAGQNGQEPSSSRITLFSNKAAPSRPPSEPGLFRRLTNVFWSTVIRPSGPTSVMPKPTPPDPDFPAPLRAHIRRRYGVLRSTHPWTMQHMRTLHRMHNSCTSGKIDSIIPKTGPLPAYLRILVDTTQKSVSGFEYTFTNQHAHVVLSFLQVLVPLEIIEAMERGEVEMLGDGASQSYKGTDFLGRNGGDLVEGIYRDLTPKRGQIDGLWVMKCLGDCVMANIGTAERLAREAAARARLEEEGSDTYDGKYEEDEYQEDQSEENEEKDEEILPSG